MVPASGSSFRTDIEGLRAVAILPILLFHLDPSWVPNGYAGVDIFFVISGYLISGQILKAQPGQFRFLPFYLRRIRRLFPALAVTVAVSMLAAWRLLPPQDLKALAWSALASLFGVANIHFYSAVDYFNESSLLHPLLHIWSLSAEEQFYLLWPAILVTLLTLGRSALRTGILVIGAISLLASAIVTARDPYLAFYMMPFRMYEFAIGAAVGLFVVDLPSWQARLCGFAGAGLLVATFLLFNTATPWPGVNALLPCSGTALLIIGGRAGMWHHILSLPPLRLTGRISYSVYLVHWPLIVFYRSWIVVPPSPFELAGLFAASLVLGALLYIFVERFYRVSPEPKLLWLAMGPHAWQKLVASLETVVVRRQGRLFALFLVVPMAAAGFSAAVIARDGFPERMKRDRVQQAGELSFADDICNSSRDRCSFGDVSSSHIVYLMGDSYALNLVYGLDRLFKQEGIRGIAFYDHGCLFLKGTQRFIRGAADRACARNVEAAFEAISRDRHPVIIAGNYGGYVKAIGAADANEPFAGTGRDYVAWIEKHFLSSLAAIDARSRPTILFSSAYSTSVDTAKCAEQFGAEDARCKPATLLQARQSTEEIDSMIAGLRSDFPTLTILDPKPPFCSEESCTVRIQDAPLFRDTAHLTNEGSDFLISRLRPALMAALKPN